MQALNTVSQPTVNVDTTSKDHAKKYVELEVEKVQADIKSKNTTSGSRYSPITFSPKGAASDYSGEVNTLGTVETTTAVTPTTEDENTANKDLLPDSSVEM